jgi:hypothetical protein|tara:strand:- start:195 stop:332 length:138 start_codon:yes stop_codon:yes gene_type:complete
MQLIADLVFFVLESRVAAMAAGRYRSCNVLVTNNAAGAAESDAGQ